MSCRRDHAIHYYLLYQLPVRADLVLLQPQLHRALYICTWSDLLQLLPTGKYNTSGCLVCKYDTLAAAFDGMHLRCQVDKGFDVVDGELPVYTPALVRFMRDTGRLDFWL